MVRSDIAMQAGAQSVSQPPTPRAFVVTLSVDDAANMGLSRTDSEPSI
jgi:hypothetical protein